MKNITHIANSASSSRGVSRDGRLVGGYGSMRCLSSMALWQWRLVFQTTHFGRQTPQHPDPISANPNIINIRPQILQDDIKLYVEFESDGVEENSKRCAVVLRFVQSTFNALTFCIRKLLIVYNNVSNGQKVWFFLYSVGEMGIVVYVTIITNISQIPP